ncbi:MAG: C25 family cysteine peptidase [Bacteroidetes bacterium]|nr:C25 family cysteine peptidase [Bacteroidota bacterium]
MRDKLFILMILLGSFICRGGNVEMTYYPGEYSLSSMRNYDVIRFRGAMLSGLKGEPALPYLSVSLALPPGESAAQIEIIPGPLEEIPGTFHLMPYQPSRTLSSSGSPEFMVNAEIYQSNIPYPSRIYGEVTTGFLHGVSVAMTNLCPLVYIPSTGKVSCYKYLTVRIITKKDEKAQAALKNLFTSNTQLEEVKAFCQNPDLVDQYPYLKLLADNYQVLIVTGPSYTSGFSNLVDLYKRRGLRSAVVSTNVINSQSPGQDLQEKIRNYIIQEYQNHGIDYVILGGDVDVIPARGFYCHVQSSSVYEDWNIPSDLYYSSLDGTWDDNNNQTWGEIGEDDLLPEIAVGRIPFSNLQEMNTMLNKTISYQNTPVAQELNRMLMLGEKLMDAPETWGDDYLDLLIGSHTDNGYTTDGIDDTTGMEKMYDRDLPQPWDTTQLLSSLNAGKAFIYHSGHASTFYNMRLYDWDITNENFQEMDGINHNFCLIYSHGCYSGAFDESDCIAESMMKIQKFAVGFVGNSRYGWFNEGTTDGPSEHLNREFVNALYHNKLYRLGETHRQSRIQTASFVNAPGQFEEGALRWCFYDCNVLGDPVLGIWTSIPQPLVITCPTTIAAYSTGMSIQVSDGTNPVEGITCAYVVNNVLLGAAVTDPGGIAQITFDIPPASPGAIGEMVASGYNRLATVYTVPVTGTTGIQPPVSSETEIRVKISPNPFSDVLLVSIDIPQSQSFTFELSTPEGKKIKEWPQQMLMSGHHDLPLTIDVADLAPGMYFLKVNLAHKALNFKIIKD